MATQNVRRKKLRDSHTIQKTIKVDSGGNGDPIISQIQLLFKKFDFLPGHH